MSQSYLTGFNVEGLLARGGWPGATKKETDQYWNERFLIRVPESLIALLLPFLEGLKEKVAALGVKAGNSMRAACEFYPFIAIIVIQDAAHSMARRFPEHPVHVLLNSSAEFR